MIKKEIISDTDSVYNYMDGETVLGYLEIIKLIILFLLIH